MEGQELDEQSQQILQSMYNLIDECNKIKEEAGIVDDQEYEEEYEEEEE